MMILNTGAISDFWVAAIGSLYFFGLGLLSIFLYVNGVRREEKEAINQGHNSTGSPLLNSHLREWYFEKIYPFENFFIQQKITPNQLTLIGFALSILAALFFHLGWMGTGGWFVLLAGTFDIFDGAIARKTNQCTASGGYFDSVLDRYAEMIVYLGLVSFFRDSFMMWVVIAALIGSIMVSYTRAKSESIGVQAKVGIMQRPERFVYLGFGGMFSVYIYAFFGSWGIPQHLFLCLIVGFIALMSNITAFRRFRFTLLTLDGVLPADANEKGK